MSGSASDRPESVGGDAALWQRLRELAEAETGMVLSGNNLPRLREATVRVLSPDDLPRRLEAILDDPVHQAAFLDRLTAELTVGETFFFRNEHHFRALAENVIPRIVRENDVQKEIRIWAAGCSTGEEPYSLAILLDQWMASRPPWHVSILATDLNPNFLERARRGLYRKWSFRGTDIQRNPVYFERQGEQYRLTPRIRKRVRFGYLNLVKDVFPSALNGTFGLDLIVFRNVAIYLKPEIVNAVIQRFHDSLRPGGWLLLGETELSMAAVPQFEVHRFDRAVFHRRKRDRDEPEGRAAPRVSARALSATAPPVLPSVQPSLLVSTTSHPSDVSPVSPEKAPSGSVELPAVLAFRKHKNLRSSETDLTEGERTVDAIVGQKERATARLKFVLQLLSCAEMQRAGEMLEECLEEEPLLIEAHLLKATLAEEAGDFDEAERGYRRALYVDRKCAIAHFHLALVQREKGDVRGSGRSLQTVLKLTRNRDPHGLVEHSDGVCYGRLREMAEMLLD